MENKILVNGKEIFIYKKIINMKIEHIQRLGKMYRVTFTKNNKTYLKIFENQNEFKTWKRENDAETILKFVGIFIAFYITIYLLITIINVWN